MSFLLHRIMETATMISSLRESFLLFCFLFALGSCSSASAHALTANPGMTQECQNHLRNIDRNRQSKSFLLSATAEGALIDSSLIAPSADYSYCSQVLPAPDAADSASLCMEKSEVNDLEPPCSCPPFPAAIELPMGLEVLENDNNSHCLIIAKDTYIPGDTKSGGQKYRACTTISQEAAREHNNKALILGRLGRWSEAITEHGIALRAEPQNATFVKNLSCAELRFAEQLEQSGNLRGAANHYRRALYTDKNNATADNKLDNCLQRSGMNRLDPKICRQLADKFMRDGSLEDAIVEFQKLANLVDSGRVHAGLGTLLFKAGKVSDARRELNLAVAKTDWQANECKDLARCHRELADILLQSSHKAEAIGSKAFGGRCLLNAWVEYKRSLFLDPTDRESIKRLFGCSATALLSRASYNNWLAFGSACLLFNDLDEAKESYDMCVQLDPENPLSEKARATLERARILIKQKASEKIGSTKRGSKEAYGES